MHPAWKVPEASTNRIVCLFVCPLFRPAYKQSAIFKDWVMIQLPNLNCTFIYGFLTLHWHHMPLGVGRLQNVGLNIFAIFWLCCHQGHPCFTNTHLVELKTPSKRQQNAALSVITPNLSISEDRIDELKVIFLEEEIKELKHALRESRNRNNYLQQLLEQAEDIKKKQSVSLTLTLVQAGQNGHCLNLGFSLVLVKFYWRPSIH